MGDQPVGRPLPAHRTAQTQNKRTQTSMPQVGPCLFTVNPKYQYFKVFLKIDATTYFMDGKGVLQD
jgi:hypothetical protein